METKLLVVDDNAEIASIVTDMLSDLFDDVVAVGTVDEAKELLTNTKFSIMILDINLEGRNGAEVLKFLTDNPDGVNAVIPSIIVSGIATPEFINRNSKKFVGILLKPFDHSELRKLVEAGLKK